MLSVPQVGCQKRKMNLAVRWAEVTGADVNGRERNRGDEVVLGRNGDEERNLEGQDGRMEMAVVSRDLKKRDEHRRIYKTGEQSHRWMTSYAEVTI